MHANGAVDFKLESLGDGGRTRLELGAEEDAAVAVTVALKFEGQVEVFVVLFRLQVAVVFGERDAVDSASFNNPLFFSNLGPVGKVFAVEQLDPILAGCFELGGLGGEESDTEKENESTHLGIVYRS